MYLIWGYPYHDGYDFRIRIIEQEKLQKENENKKEDENKEK